MVLSIMTENQLRCSCDNLGRG